MNSIDPTEAAVAVRHGIKNLEGASHNNQWWGLFSLRAVTSHLGLSKLHDEIEARMKAIEREDQ